MDKNLNQYSEDIEKFINLLSKYTKISKRKISNFLSENKVSMIFEHPTAMDLNVTQIQRLKELRQLKGLYNNLKNYEKEYTITSPDKAAAYLREMYPSISDKEYFSCLFLDNGNRVISANIIQEGTVNMASIYPREIAKTALLYDTTNIILAHNHPGGSVRPSDADLSVTRKIGNALNLLNINTLDHIILTNKHFFSFKEHGISLYGNEHLSEISSIYANEFPAIKYIREETASRINQINKTMGSVQSIKDIKNLYYKCGKKLEKEPSTKNTEEFKNLKKIMSDLNQAQLKNMQNKTINNVKSINKSIDLIQ